MTRTLQERPGLPGRGRHDPLDNREHVLGACAKLAGGLRFGRTPRQQSRRSKASRKPW